MQSARLSVPPLNHLDYRAAVLGHVTFGVPLVFR